MKYSEISFDVVNNLDFSNTGHGPWYMSAQELKHVNVIPKNTKFLGNVSWVLHPFYNAHDILGSFLKH